MFEEMKERAWKQECAERARLSAMSEKALLIELILEIRKLNNTVVDKADDIKSTVIMGNNW